MMNDARFQVGLQGLGARRSILSKEHSPMPRDRLQSRAPQGVQQPDQKADGNFASP